MWNSNSSVASTPSPSSHYHMQMMPINAMPHAASSPQNGQMMCNNGGPGSPMSQHNLFNGANGKFNIVDRTQNRFADYRNHHNRSAERNKSADIFVREKDAKETQMLHARYMDSIASSSPSGAKAQKQTKLPPSNNTQPTHPSNNMTAISAANGTNAVLSHTTTSSGSSNVPSTSTTTVTTNGTTKRGQKRAAKDSSTRQTGTPNSDNSVVTKPKATKRAKNNANDTNSSNDVKFNPSASMPVTSPTAPPASPSSWSSGPVYTPSVVSAPYNSDHLVDTGNSMKLGTHSPTMRQPIGANWPQQMLGQHPHSHPHNAHQNNLYTMLDMSTLGNANCHPVSHNMMGPDPHQQMTASMSSMRNHVKGHLLSLNNAMNDPYDLDLDSLQGGLDCDVDSIIRHELNVDGNLDFNFENSVAHAHSMNPQLSGHYATLTPTIGAHPVPSMAPNGPRAH